MTTLPRPTLVLLAALLPIVGGACDRAASRSTTTSAASAAEEPTAAPASSAAPESGPARRERAVARRAPRAARDAEAAATPADAGDLEATRTAAPPARTERARGARRPLDAGRIEEHLARAAWWHQEATARRVGLTAEQPGQLDAILRRLAPQLRDGAIALREARVTLSQALAAGDWARARQLAKRRGAAAAALSQAQTELIIDGLGVLTAAQRRQLASAAPELLEEPWLRPPGPDDRPVRRRAAAGAPGE